VPKRTLDWRLEEAERRRKKPSTAKIPNTPEEFCESIQFKPDDWQLQIMHEVADLSKPSDILANISRQGGKHLRIDTPIPTPTGWTTMGALKVGDTVFDEQGTPVPVTYCSEITTKATYLIRFTDKSELVAGAEHLWTTLNAKTRGSMCYYEHDIPINWPFWESPGRSKDGSDKRRAETLTTDEIRTTLHTGYVRIGRKTPHDTNHAIPTTQPLDLPTKDLPIDPYTLGAWLGDGTASDGSITCQEPEIIDNIRATGYDVSKQKSHHAQGWGILGLLVPLRELGLKNNKHIPATYLRASIEQRAELLRGLMDTDGGVDYGGTQSTCEL